MSKAVFYSLLAKLWGVISSPITLVFISFFFTADVQGYYYTFFSLVALQTFLELSFSIVILNFASHEWSLLHMTQTRDIAGDPDSLSRLAHLTKFSIRWYTILASLFFVLVGTGGYWFLQAKHSTTVAWQGPWCALVVLVSLQLCLLPVQSIVDGCNQVARMSMVRMTASVAANLCFWTAILNHCGLWSLCISFAVNLVVQIALIVRYYGVFFRRLLLTPVHATINWSTEVLPVQWRLATGSVVNYFSTSIFIPVMFWYHGPRVAGQMGVGWQIMGAAQTIALTWVQANIPTFGSMIAHKKYDELDHFFKRILFISYVVLIALCAVAWSLVKVTYQFYPHFSERFMPLWPLAIFLMAAIMYHLPQCQAIYLRAHKQEPLLVVSVVANMMIGATAWIFGKNYGMVGAGLAYLICICCINVPVVFWIWIERRREWHA